MIEPHTFVANACSKCGCAIEPLSADPGLWAVWISLPGDNGENKVYHARCITNPIGKSEKFNQIMSEAYALLNSKEVAWTAHPGPWRDRRDRWNEEVAKNEFGLSGRSG